MDYREIPGYKLTPDTCPSWKRYLYERRNERLVEEYVRAKQTAINEHFKWLGASMTLGSALNRAQS